MKKLIQNLFSVKNERVHKVCTILGVKFKLINYKKLQQQYSVGIEHLQLQQQELFCKQHELCSKITKTIPMVKLRNFEVHITEHCNLNCQCCNHYSPLAKKEFLDINLFRKDMERMAKLTHSEVEYINLLGGEPLLHPELLKFFNVTRELFQNTRINLATNGILLNQQPQSFWDSCRTNAVYLCITQYPININLERIKETAKNNDVKIEIWGHENEPIKHSWFFPIDLDGKFDARENFLNCRDANNCIFLRDGKLFTCVAPPNIHHFNKHFDKNVPVSESDYIDIYKVKSIREVLEFLAKPIPFCSYCNVNARRFDLDWKTTSKDINEWVNN